STLGSKWTFNWFSYVQDNPNNPSQSAFVYLPLGGGETYSSFDAGTQSYAPHRRSHAVLVRMSSTSYERRLSDGSVQTFAQVDGATAYPRKVFLTRVS